MARTESAVRETGYLDTLARQDTLVHRVDPRAKVITALAFVITVVSFDRYEVSALVPYVVYLVVLTRLAGLPARYLLGRVALVSPFAILIGFFNPIFDQTVIAHVGPFDVSGGWISFATILMRFALTVYAALLLVATTGFNSVCIALERLKVPTVFVVQLMLLYRYLFVLGEEAARMVRAHALRAVGGRRISLKVFGSLLGLLLLRALDRAHRIYVAMLCRGFDGELRLAHPLNFRAADWAFTLGWIGFFLLARYFNLSQLLGQTLMELLP